MDGTSRPALAPHQNGVQAGGRPVSLMATLGEPRAATDAYLRLLTPAVGYVEVRADVAGDTAPWPDPLLLRGRCPGALLYTLRSTAAGGGCTDPPDRRHQRLSAAAERYDCVDLEAPGDLRPDVLEAIPPERRVVSWYGPVAGVAGLRRAFDTMTSVKARLYRLAPPAETLAQAVSVPLFLKSLARNDVMAYARGPAGTWTRLLSATYGAPLLSGRLDAAAVAESGPPPDGELPLPRLAADYPELLLAGARRLYGIIGAQVTLSLAQRIYNTACVSLGLPALFLPFSTQELRSSLAELSAGLDDLGLPLRGATVVRPHKEDALAIAAGASPLARRTRSACLLVRTGAAWWADNEAAGVVATLTGKGVEVTGRRIAVVGCGGAGRAAAAGLTLAGAEVTLINRGETRGERAAKLLDLPYVPLRDFDPRPYSVLVHATPAIDEPPFAIDGMDPATVIFDLNYRPMDTPLIAAAKAAGHATIEGRDMLLAELPRQFQLMTGWSMPAPEAGVAPARREG